MMSAKYATPSAANPSALQWLFTEQVHFLACMWRCVLILLAPGNCQLSFGDKDEPGRHQRRAAERECLYHDGGAADADDSV